MTRTEEPAPPVVRRIDPADLRSVLGHFCTGVTVITAHDGENPHGFTCQSFVSLSLDPPYVSFSPARTSTSWPRLRASEHVCVNVLAHDQRDVCGTFATSGADKFAGVGWSHAGNGAPALDGVLARVQATVEFEHDAGDHTIVVARVTGLDVLRDVPPLLVYRGGLGIFTAAT
ncbi:MAG: flavin reductase family protein [Rhodococcus sp. (in: high G+C Gram-positive bacteria)]